jgi:hypothetical protein
MYVIRLILYNYAIWIPIKVKFFVIHQGIKGRLPNAVKLSLHANLSCSFISHLKLPVFTRLRMNIREPEQIYLWTRN